MLYRNLFHESKRSQLASTCLFESIPPHINTLFVGEIKVTVWKKRGSFKHFNTIDVIVTGSKSSHGAN